MTMLGYFFWSTVVIIGAVGFWMDRKYKAKALEKSLHQIQQEEIINIELTVLSS